ncbi:hypothetical protein MCOR25_005354 [Pyricularia grisea]|nr:hypothetical protein MCOR25_005354 [Pyricularia grisea]
MAPHENHTVGIICANGFEMSAVQYMLDNKHTRLFGKDGSDPNIYISGELSGHNVILACLAGVQGKGAAATVATNMARSFPSIKWRFLVGIGGGVPSSRHDIRLGDVVVSMPEGQYGGVVQYDLIKDEDDGFRLKGILCAPPTLLRNAVEMMRSDHFEQENKIGEYLSIMLKKGPRFSIYARPAAHTDILFDEEYAHASGCSTCGGCDKTKVVSRPPREGPEIHYGLIASGDSVMKSATKRNEKVHNLGDVLCFDMEAAGLMTEYSCIVIRGVSDYADSHKNDDWQHYAAAAAAACAKELLSYVDPETSSSKTVGSSRTESTAHNQRGVRMILHGQGIQSTGSFSVGRDLIME